MDIVKVKRQSSFNQSVDAEKELSLATPDEQSTPVTCIEDLSNEIFYEIFDYLNGCDIFDSFSNLNTRLHDLLNSPLLSLKFHHLSTSEQIFHNHYKHFIIPNKQRIICLVIWHRPHINLFVNQYPIDSSFSRLESLVLKNITSKKFVSLCPNLSCLPRLFSLTIRLGDVHPDVGSVYEKIFKLPFLKYHKTSILLYSMASSFSLTQSQGSSILEHIVINHRCTVNELSTILLCTPQLRRLICKALIQRLGDVTREEPITLFQLTHVSIGECSIKFDEFEIFISKLCSQFQVLNVSIKSNDKAYCNAARWNRLISQQMPYLRKFNFEYNVPINGMFHATPYHPLSNLFSSSFWSEWRWFFEFVIYRDMAKYSIHSYKDSYCEMRKYATNDAYCNHYFSSSNLLQHVMNESRLETVESSIQSNLLTINFLNDTRMGLSSEEVIRPFFSAVQFTHLSADCHDVSIITLMELLQLLPHLDYLKISSIPVSFTNRLSPEQAETFRLVSNSNKITKIYINNLKDIAEADFLVDLCPHMEYLEIDCSNNADVELLVVSVLINHDINCIPHLRTLCVRVQNGNDDLIENLQQTINAEKLLNHFKINRIGNNIILQWK